MPSTMDKPLIFVPSIVNIIANLFALKLYPDAWYSSLSPLNPGYDLALPLPWFINNMEEADSTKSLGKQEQPKLNLGEKAH